jgi:hypothetical protein
MEAAVSNQPDDSPLRRELDNARCEIVDKLLRVELWAEAARQLDSVFLRNPAILAQDYGYLWQFHARLHLMAGNPAGFRTSCAAFFKQFLDFDNKSNLYQACLAGVDALPPQDLKLLAEMAEKDLSRNPNNNSFLLFAAMTRARAGNHSRALELLDQTQPEVKGTTKPPTAAARAIVLYHLGRVDEAKKALALADGDLEQSHRDAFGGMFPTTIADTLVLAELLNREAHLLIYGKQASANPYSLLVRARVLGRRGRDSESETALAAATAARPDDTQVSAAAAQIRAERGRQSRLP